MTTEPHCRSIASLRRMFREKGPGPFDSSGSSNQNPGGLSFVELIKEDFEAHGRNWFSPGFRALAVHRFGNWRMDIRLRPLRAPVSVLYRRMYRRMIRQYGIELEYSGEIGRRVVIDHQSGIVISGLCRIGDGCRIRHGVTMGVRRIGEFGCPTIGRNVDIGVGAVILGDIHIGDDAAIGACALVISDVPAGAIAVGVPARIIRRQEPAVAAPLRLVTVDDQQPDAPLDDRGDGLSIVDVR